MQVIPELLEEIRNLPRIREHNIISEVSFKKANGKDLMNVYFKENGFSFYKSFDADASDFSEQVAEWIVTRNICQIPPSDAWLSENPESEFNSLSTESKKAIFVAQKQLEIKSSFKKELDTKIDNLKNELIELLNVSVNDAFKAGLADFVINVPE